MTETVPIKLPTQTKELALNGNCRYNLDGDSICLNIQEIANNRSSSTTSSDLSVELWALPRPYEGGAFSGHALTMCYLPPLSGQQSLRNWEYCQPIQSPPEGYWYLTLMLREAENGVYVTRDHVNFPNRIKADYKLTLSFA